MKNNYTQMEENKEEAVPFLIYDQNTKSKSYLKLYCSIHSH